MIDKIHIKGFKCFDKKEFDLSNLTLLTGVNSGGKSSLIQALLLLSQNITSSNLSPLNGHLVSVGDFVEAKNFITNAKEFTIGVTKDSQNLSYSFKEDNNNCLSEVIENSENIRQILDYNNRHIHYLSADRIGVKDIYDKNLDQADKYGVFGEYVFDFFEKNKSMSLDSTLIKDNSSFTLDNQLNYWLKCFLQDKNPHFCKQKSSVDGGEFLTIQSV